MERIVLVDDDADIRRISEKRLRAAGYEVFTAADGLAGLEVIRAEKPKVVLLDLMMPKMHGYAVCQEIRKDPELRGIQIIVTSAKAYPVDIQKAKDMGANSYLTKPFDLEEMVQQVKSAMQSSGPALTVRFWGTRGSCPTPGSTYVRYGGNTSCVEVRSGDAILMFECGTGAREMGMALDAENKGKPLDVHVFISHTHWDHIQGFPFFTPAYSPGNRITVYSLRGSDKSLEKVFTGQMDASYFPVSLTDLSGRLKFVELDGVVQIGETRISHIYLNHPGLALGFRVEVGSKSVVYMTDHELYSRISGENAHTRKLDNEVNEFARGASLYIREAQYTDEEYPSKKGWGHSTWRDALESAHAAQVKMLALYHHDPMRDDAGIDQVVADCQQHIQEHGMSFSCFAAADNQQIIL